MKEIIQKYTIIKCKRQPNNLKRLLTKAKFTDTQELPKISKCNRPNCGVCEHLITENEFLFQYLRSLNVEKGICYITVKTRILCKALLGRTFSNRMNICRTLIGFIIKVKYFLNAVFIYYNKTGVY